MLGTVVGDRVFLENAGHRPTAAAKNKTPDKTQHEWNTGTDGVPMFSYSQVLLLLTLVPASAPTREGRNNAYHNAHKVFVGTGRSAQPSAKRVMKGLSVFGGSREDERRAAPELSHPSPGPT